MIIHAFCYLLGSVLYRNRGIVKERAELPYCSDYKRACDLGDEDCCEWYSKQCK